MIKKKNIALTLLNLAISSTLFAQSFTNNPLNGVNFSHDPINGSGLSVMPPEEKLTGLDHCNVEWAEECNEEIKSFEPPSKNMIEEENSSLSDFNSLSRLKNTTFAKAGIRYTTGLGIRLGGWESGLSVKHFFKGNKAIEGILSSGWNYGGVRITGLYEIQKTVPGLQRLYWFYGVGAHLGLHNERYWYSGECNGGYYKYKGRLYSCGGSRTTIGIDGIIGLEYLFTEIPITVGFDLKPSIDLIGWGGHYGDSAFTIRYAF